VRDGLVVAERFGGAGANARWLRFEPVHIEYWQGRWDESVALIDEVLSEVGPSHALSRYAYEMRGRIKLGRDDVDGAVEDAERSLALGRQAKDPQTLLPALSFAALVMLEAGRAKASADLADELLSLNVAEHRVPHHVSPIFELAWVLIAFGRSDELRAAIDRVGAQTRWLVAADAIARGDLLAAADMYAEIGTRANEAYTRLRGAAQLLEAGRRADADQQLRPALAFWRSVGAKRYVREGEALLAATA
jgi:tetratricopeptide (TPR) repeat protein